MYLILEVINYYYYYLGDVVGHGCESLVGHLVQLLTVSLVHKMSPSQKIPEY